MFSPFDAQGQPVAVRDGTLTPELAPEPGPLLAIPSTPPHHAGLPSPMAPLAPRSPGNPLGGTPMAIPMAPSAAAPMAPPTPPGLSSPPRVQRGLSVLPAAPRGASVEPPQSFVLGLAAMAEGWPEAVRREIVQLNLVEAKVALPGETIECALKQGRVAFSWKTLRSWIRPAVPPSASPADSLVVEVPLSLIAPLFLARQRQTSQSRQAVTIDEQIPNLFFGFPKPEAGSAGSAPAPAAAAPAAANSNYYTWDDAADTVRQRAEEARRGPNAGTRFAAKHATPNEIVSRAAALDNVAGALIGLPDGLLVASRLGPDLNADTLAAFLPQIFARVSQCIKELRMGELNNLNFTVGSTPWKIFRVNSIFFAAFGCAGAALPASQLAALAAELAHKPK